MEKKQHISLKLLTSLKEHIGIIWTISWSISGNFLISIGVDSSLIIWGPIKNLVSRNMYRKSIGEINYFKSWKKIYKIELFQRLRTFRGLGRKINSNYFSISDFQNNSYMIEASFFKCLKTCLVAIKHCIKEHSSEIKSCQFSSDEIVYASGGRDRSIWFWKNYKNEKINCDFILKNRDSDIKNIKWNPVYLELISCTYEGVFVIIIYENEEKLTFEHKVCNSTILNFFFEATGQKIISGNTAGELLLINLVTIKDFMTLKKKRYPELLTIFFSNNGTISSLAQSDKHFIFSFGNIQGNINMVKNKKLTKKLDLKKNKTANIELYFKLKPFVLAPHIHFGKINAISWHPIFDNIFASSGDDSTINICRLEG
jgi:WD40 repeat protein